MFIIVAIVLLLSVNVKSQDDFKWYNKIPPKTVDSIELSAYLGVWYQTYSSFLANQTYEKDSYCTTAEYTAATPTFEGYFYIKNAENVGSPTGPKKFIEGINTLPDSTTPGKWVIKFNSSSSGDVPKLPGLYWIIKLGPINPTTSLYDYSVVSVPLGVQLFILARNVSEFQTLYEKDLITELEEEGFNTPFNKPLPTYQLGDCVY
eukprot:gene18748-24514_t